MPAVLLRVPLALALVAYGCAPGSTQPSGSLASDAALTVESWVALDLADGSITPVAEPVDPAAAAWRGSRVLFRQVEAGSALVGRAVADITAQDDEHPQRRISAARAWIAANELSQRQWLALAGSRPWLAVLPVADPFAWIGEDLPAFGISPTMAQHALAGWGRDGWQLDLPDSEEWERACLAGTSSKFAWGDGLDDGVAWAVCDAPHPLPIGGRRGNAWGLHDMHGNVWEIVHDGLAWQIRGGAWDQPVVTARASNQLAITAETVGWSVGIRPMLRR